MTAPVKVAYEGDLLATTSAQRLDEAWAWARRWLFDEALPLWASEGLAADGGFVDQIGDDRRAVAAPKRLRVQGRQVMVFAEAGRAGWTGPWRRAVDQGLAFLRETAPGEDGFLRSTFEDGRAWGFSLYDHTFALLALAHGRRATGEAWTEEMAVELWRNLRRRLGRRDGGFHEADAEAAPFQANPNMHLYEAVQAWRAASGLPLWAEAADRLGRLGSGAFVDGASGRLLEFFDCEGRPAAGELGAQVEPGHQFEWAWLLLGDPAADHAAAERMAILAARTGVDRERGVAINGQRPDGAPLDRKARLWPQTERLRAALAMRVRPGADQAFWTAEALDSIAAIRRYLDAAGGGLWRDVMLEDGSFLAEPTKASSLYHLTGAFMALREAVEPEPA